MRVCLWIALAIVYLFIGFWVAYFLYRKTDCVFKTTTNILLWPIICFVLILALTLAYINDRLIFISKMIEHKFDKMKRKRRK